MFTSTSTVPGLRRVPAAETWYIVPVTGTDTTAPKCWPWLRERAACTAPPPVQTIQSRSCVSTVSAMCGSPPTKEPRKSTPSPAGEPPRNGTTVTPVAGSPGGHARNVVPEWSATSGTRSVCCAVGLSGVELVGAEVGAERLVEERAVRIGVRIERDLHEPARVDRK